MESNTIPVLQTEPARGLTETQARQRQAAGLRNTPPPDLTKSTARILRDNLLTFYNLLFLALAGCLVAVGAVQETLFLGIVVCNAAVGVVQELRVRAALRRIALLAARPVRTVRDGTEQLLDTADLVRDDIVRLRPGDQVPADAVLVEGRAECNESLVTGEEDPVLHTPGDPLLSGSFLVAGSCAARLVQVGPDSCAARITGEARRARTRRSRMMRSLDAWLRFVGVLILPLGLAMVWQQWAASGPRAAVTGTVAALVGMIPEGLYLLVSIALAVSVLNLARRHTLVRELTCIENLAHVDVLCLDKTGTLTAGQMQAEELLPVSGLSQPELAALLGGYVHAMPETNATDRALREAFPSQGWQAQGQVPFSSARKWGAALLPDGRCLILGAPELVLGTDCAAWQPKLAPRLAQGRRVLVLAQSSRLPDGSAPLPAGLRPLGFVVLRDKLRPGTAETLAYFRSQGVTLRVLSGDNAAAVSRVALQAGVENADRYLDLSGVGEDADWADLARRYTVFGRVSPRQKQKLIAGMQAAGHTVAMIGDGVNDVPALGQADCSLAMGAGSEAARQAAQMVLLDSDFAAVPAILQEGRRVIGNISRSAALFLYKNIFSFLVSAVLLFVALPYPMVPRQISLISGLLIGLPSFLLTFEPVRGRARGGFMTGAVLSALPGGLTATLGVLAAGTLGAGLPRNELSTVCTLLAALAGMLVILRLCVPLTPLRGAVLTLCLGGFAGACLLLPGLFALSPLSGPALRLLGVCAAGTVLVFALLQGVSEWLRQRPFRAARRPAALPVRGRRSDAT